MEIQNIRMRENRILTGEIDGVEYIVADIIVADVRTLQSERAQDVRLTIVKRPPIHEAWQRAQSGQWAFRWTCYDLRRLERFDSE